MPQDFLRDVLRTGDVSGRVRRRLSVLPVSIAVHAVAVLLFVMSPFITDAELPAIASSFPAPVMPTVLPPNPPPPSTPTRPAATEHAAPIAAPDRIQPDAEKAPSGPVVEGALPPGPGEAVGAPVLGALNFDSPPKPPEPVTPAPQVPFRPGGAIREPKKIVHVPPQYPDLAQRAGVQGSVILEATLDVNGSVDRIRVLKSQPLLDDAALRAVRQWRYTPTLLNGVPVPILMTITVTFSLTR